MSILLQLVCEFWMWAGLPEEKWGSVDVRSIQVDPIYYPKFDKMRNQCISLINTSLCDADVNTFLTCMALDAEEEYILDYCKTYAEDEFIEHIVSVGVSHFQSDARWQVAELLRRRIPKRDYYLCKLCNDSDPYVRRRAHNVANAIT